MNPQKTSPAASMFEKVLRAFETRGITYSDVLARLRRLLTTGASPTELLAILRRRESAERMPEYARLEALLIEAVEQSAADDEESGSAQPRDPITTDPRGSAPGPSSGTSLPNPSAGSAAAEPQQPEDEVALDLEFDAPAKAFNTPRGLRASELDLSVLARHLRSVEERIPPRGASLEALTRSFEKAREGESAAAERAAALSADLAAAGAALQAEQGKLREVEQALAQSVAAGQAAREAALRELQQYQAELRTLRDSLAERDAALERAKQALSERDAALDRTKQALSERDTSLDRTRQVLSERDSRLAALSRERTALERALEARTQAAADSAAAAPRAAHARAPVAEPPATPMVDVGREEAPAPPAPPAPTLSPELRRPRRLGGPARAIGWSAAALLVVVFAWLFAHRSPPQPAEPLAAAAPAPGSVIRDCAGCPEMTVLPAGRFKQGSARGPAFEQPLHWVVIGRSIAMSTSPVTLQDFGQFVAATGRDMQGCDTYDGEWKHRPADSWEHTGFVQTAAHPVTCVSWSDAEAYANWLSTKTGHRYRLPSASEWEYAARAGAEISPLWGPDGQGACAEANVADASAGRRYPGWAVFPCDDGYAYTSPVGTFKANAFGLTDMLGNVLQWTEDCWHENYAGAPVDGSAWLDGDCAAHELRGASWFSSPSYVRADYRDRFPADYRTSSVGIRLVRDIGP